MNFSKTKKKQESNIVLELGFGEFPYVPSHGYLVT